VATKNVFEGVYVPCCWDGTQDVGNPCACGEQERVLRSYADNLLSLPPMTDEQRDWCLDEIGKVEGYDRSEHENDTDVALAQTVLRAWTDYCRDKGMM
jgi:hypothetical protein